MHPAANIRVGPYHVYDLQSIIVLPASDNAAAEQLQTHTAGRYDDKNSLPDVSVIFRFRLVLCIQDCVLIVYMSERKKRLYAYIAFGILTCTLFWLKTRHGAVAGSKTDWISQHTAFAEYFRSRFYQTHDFFPQFAAEISGGVNIYYFAYYGLMNPFYLLSYAFPWIPMTIWVMMLSAICYWLDGCLALKWLS